MPKGLLLFKEADLRRAIRTFQKLGLPIARAEIERDGKIVVIVGEGKQGSKANEWGMRFMAKINLKHVNSFYDRHCKLRGMKMILRRI
jgi:hypothetical protein